MADSTPEYELIYWPTIPGRGEFIRLLFAATATPFKDHPALSIPDSVALVTSFTSDTNTGDASNPPILACPALRHGDLVISQTFSILTYLAPRLGMTGDDSDVTRAHLLSIAMTIYDGLCVEAHDAHHPIAGSLRYEEQMDESKRRSANFLEERMPKFLGYVQRVLQGEASGDGPWLYKGSMTYADLVAFLVRDMTPFLPASFITNNPVSRGYALRLSQAHGHATLHGQIRRGIRSVRGGGIHAPDQGLR